MQQHEHVPEFYGDGWALNLNDYTARITIGEIPEVNVFLAKASIRMPLSQAKELALFLRKAIKDMERGKSTTVHVRTDLLERWGIALEDW